MTRFIAAGQAVVVVVVLLGERELARVADVDAADRRAIGSLQAHSANVDVIAFAGLFALLQQFDSLVKAQKDLDEATRVVATRPLHPSVKKQLDVFAGQLNDRSAAIEQVKSFRGALTNVELYLPSRLEELRMAHPDDAGVPQVRTLLLSYLLNPSPEHLYALGNFIEQLQKRPKTDPLAELLPHLQLFTENRGVLGLSAQQMLERSLSRSTDDLVQAAESVAVEHRQQATRLRLGGIGALLLLSLASLWWPNRRPKKKISAPAT